MLRFLGQWPWQAKPCAPAKRAAPRRILSLERLEERTLLAGPEITVLDALVPISSGGSDAIELGNVARGEAGPTRVFTIRNDGNSTLQLTSLTLPAGFSIVDAPLANLVPRSSDTFTVQLDSTVVGTHSGQIIIGNNDADESIFSFSVSGTVTPNGPKIAILLGDTPVADGTQLPISWPGVVVGQTGPVRTFTIRNDGNQTLAIASITYPAAFALVGSFPLTIAPQATNTFAIRLLSATAGTKSGQIHVVSNDPDVGSYDFAIRGLVTATAVPSLSMFHNSTVVTSGSSAIDFGRAVKDQTGPSRTFVARNDGTASLLLSSLEVPAGFHIVDELVPSLAPTESDTFIVQLDSTQIASRTGDITIGSNDPNQGTFPVAITGSVVADAPQIRVFQNAYEITSGADAPIEFDTVLHRKAPSVMTFSIVNYGVRELTLGAVTLPAGFSMIAGLPPTLPPNTFSLMIVQLDSREAGVKTGEISFSTNDTTANPFRIPITGTVQASPPEITVMQQGRRLTDGTSTPLEFGVGTLGQPGPTRTFTVRNQGRGPLSIGTLTVPSGFTVIEGLPATLAPRASDTFTVQLDTAVLGDFSGEISLATNDADENPFNFAIRSRVIVAAVPQIAVQLNGTDIISGDTTAIDLGSVAFRKKSPTTRLTIRNEGDAALDLLSIELPLGFVLAKRAPKQIAAHGSALLQLRLDSRRLGSHAGQLIIHSNDATEASFAIAIQGSVLA
jgi:hypothetical protein